MSITALRPMPTEQICVQFNDLRQVVETQRCAFSTAIPIFLSRNDILLLLDLKSACDACEFELQSLKHRYEGLSPTQQSSIVLPDMVPHTPKRVGLLQFSYLPLDSYPSVFSSLHFSPSLLSSLPPPFAFFPSSFSHWPLVFR